jgi:hypothetical protein
LRCWRNGHNLSPCELTRQRVLADQRRQELQAELADQRTLIEQEAKTLAALSRRLDARLAALGR